MTDATHANLRQMLKYMQQAEAKNRDYAKAREEVEKAEARLERDLVSTKDAIDEAAEYTCKLVRGERHINQCVQPIGYCLAERLYHGR